MGEDAGDGGEGPGEAGGARDIVYPKEHPRDTRGNSHLCSGFMTLKEQWVSQHMLY